MSCPTETSPPTTALDLPAEFEDLTGLVEADLKAIATMLTRRAHERLLLSRKQYRALHRELMESLAASINETMAPMSAECR